MILDRNMGRATLPDSDLFAATSVVLFFRLDDVKFFQGRSLSSDVS